MWIKGYEIKDETVLEIGKFAILWNSFENSWCKNDCKAGELKEVAKNIFMDSYYQVEFAQELRRRCESFGQSKEDYVKNSLHPRNARKSLPENEKLMLRFIKQEVEDEGDRDLVCGCLLVIQRIRNNLMHGLKEINMLDGQIKLFRTANAVLESIKRKE